VDEGEVTHDSPQKRAVLGALPSGGGRVARDVVDGEDDAVVELEHPRDAVEIDLLQLGGPHLTRLPWHRHANSHQAEVAVNADDPVLPVHPLGGVVGDADDDLQVSRLDRPRHSRSQREGKPCEQHESESAHRLTQ
jgi:hypothetical protein